MWSEFTWTSELRKAHKSKSVSRMCVTFTQVAIRSWNWIEACELTGAPLLETSVTDLNLTELAKRHPTEVRIRQLRSREAATGADWEWWVLRGSRGLGMRVQAKRLNPTGTYPAVGRRVGAKRTAGRQIDVLIADAGATPIPTVPMYCFYNGSPGADGNHPWGLRCTPFADDRIRGCTLALATSVRAALGSGDSVDLDDIAGSCVPWSDLVCCDLDALTSAKQALRSLGLEEPDAFEVAELPEYVQALQQGGSFETAGHLAHLAGVVVFSPVE